jgi:hypothetical protein
MVGCAWKALDSVGPLSALATEFKLRTWDLRIRLADRLLPCSGVAGHSSWRPARFGSTRFGSIRIEPIPSGLPAWLGCSQVEERATTLGDQARVRPGLTRFRAGRRRRRESKSP